jgi:hypothetical protein
MQEALSDNILILKKFFEDQDFLVEETKSGMRVRLNGEYVIEVNALIRDSNFLWASFETQKLPQDQLTKILDDVRKKLSKGLAGLAKLNQFEETQDMEDRRLFVADIELLPSVTYQGIVEIQKRPAQPVQPEKTQAPVESQPKAQPVPPALSAEFMTAEKAVVLLETVDGKMLRQSLDMMNLRRSSNIRLALTRIFRGATDSDALMAAISEEAAKLVSSEDLEELKMIRLISATGFLQPVVELLCQEVFKEK